MKNKTAGQIRDLASFLVASIPQDLSENALIRCVHSKPLIAQKIAAILAEEGLRDIDSVINEWREIYTQMYAQVGLGDLGNLLSEIRIPEQKEGFNRLVIIPKGLTLDAVLKYCEGKFKIQFHPLGEFGDDSNSFINERSPGEEGYAFWVRDIADSEVEPSTTAYQRPAHPDLPELTLLERILLELKYFSETGMHLDTEHVTCCFGTLHPEGSERPVVCHRFDCVHVFWRGDGYTDVFMNCSPYWSRGMVL